MGQTMTYPRPPEASTSYTAHEQALGNGSFPGQEIDVDLAAIRASVTDLINFVKGITRSDGRLANGVVRQENLSSNLILGLDTPAPWAADMAYTTTALVFEGFGLYLCLTAHTSSVFEDDLGSGRWQLLLDLTPPGGALIAANDLSDLADVGNARDNLGLGDMATATAGTGGTQFRTNTQNEALFQQIAATLTSWIAITRASGFDSFVATPSSANLRALLTDEVGTGAAYFVGGALGTPASATLTNATGLPFAGLAAAAVVTEAEGIASNDNDTTLPTSAAVKDYVDERAAGFVYLGSQSVTSDATGIITGLGGYRRIRIVGVALDQVLTGNLQLRVGDSGGLISTSIYRYATGVLSYFIVTDDTNNPRSFAIEIDGFNTNDPVKPCRIGSDTNNSSRPVGVVSADDFDRIGVFSGGGADNIIAGTLYYWGSLE
jgi:hypothetical protein